jgi:hypothetical protein
MISCNSIKAGMSVLDVFNVGVVRNYSQKGKLSDDTLPFLISTYSGKE